MLVVPLVVPRVCMALDKLRAADPKKFQTYAQLALAIAVLAITIIGIPLAAALGIGYAALLVLLFGWGAVVGHALLGERFFERFKGGAATLMQAVVWGLAAMTGARILSDLVHVVPGFGFLGGTVRFAIVVVVAVITTIGAGALVLAEHRRRTVQDWWRGGEGRWWHRRRTPAPAHVEVTPVMTTPAPAPAFANPAAHTAWPRYSCSLRPA